MIDYNLPNNPRLPPNLDNRTFFNDLGKYFVQKIDTIRTQLDTEQQTDSLPEDDTPSAILDEIMPSFPTFMMPSVRDVKRLIHDAALNPALLTLCYPRWLINVRISS